jgi:hypothetical protein
MHGLIFELKERMNSRQDQPVIKTKQEFGNNNWTKHAEIWNNSWSVTSERRLNKRIFRIEREMREVRKGTNGLKDNSYRGKFRLPERRRTLTIGVPNQKEKVLLPMRKFIE